MSPPRRREFGATWWGRAWVDALENRARLDPNRLPRGRTYARHDRTDGLRIAEGMIEARVQGSQRTPYRVRIRVRRFDDGEWDRAIGAIAAKAAHAAALLDGELAPGIVDDLAAAGLEVLPGPGELGIECSCPDWASPCKHAAAVCYLAANALDADPFALLLLRGRTRELVMAGLRRRRTSAAAPDGDGRPPARDSTPATMPARAAAARALRPLPPPPAVAAAPGRPLPPTIEPPPSSGIDNLGLAALAADAARRAHARLAAGAASGLDLDRRHDVARLAAAALGGPGVDGSPGAGTLARRAGLAGPELTRLALAWRHGGAVGVTVLDESWTPDPERLAPGRDALGPGARARANAVTAGDVQLRLGRDARWYRFDRQGRSWDLARPPAGDPADLLDFDDRPTRPAG